MLQETLHLVPKRAWVDREIARSRARVALPEGAKCEGWRLGPAEDFNLNDYPANYQRTDHV